jgi:hypothetical protein
VDGGRAAALSRTSCRGQGSDGGVIPPADDRRRPRRGRPSSLPDQCPMCTSARIQGWMQH